MIFRLIQIFVILLVLTNIQSNAQNIERLAVNHKQAIINLNMEFELENYRDSLLIQSKKIHPGRKQVFNDIYYSIDLLARDEADSSLSLVLNQLYNNENLTYDDSLMLHQQIGHIFLQFNEFTESKYHFLEGLDIAIRHDYHISGIVGLLLNYFHITDEVDSAIYYMKKYTDKDNYNTAQLINFAQFYNFKEEGDSILKYIKMAEELNIEEKYSHYYYYLGDYLYIQLGLANGYMHKGMVDSALHYYRRCITDTSYIPNWYAYIYGNYNIANYFMEQEMYDSCSHYMKNFFICPCLDTETKIWLHEFKSDYYEKIGNEELYLQNKEMENSLRDSLLVELRNDLERLSYLNSSQKKMIKENLLLEKELNETLQIKNRAYLYITIVIAALLLIVIFFFIQRARRKKQIFKLKEELLETRIQKDKLKQESLKLEIKAKNEDLSNLATNLSMVRELADEHKDKIAYFLKLKEDILVKELKTYNRELLAQEYVDDQLQMLQQNIDEVNSKLYQKLKDKHPELSSHDIQLCALHLLNLNTKEISIIKQVTPKAIQIWRYRTRKKLNLENNEDIVDYIKKNFI